jgi:hypothetical protein
MTGRKALMTAPNSTYAHTPATGLAFVTMLTYHAGGGSILFGTAPDLVQTPQPRLIWQAPRVSQAHESVSAG